MERFNPVKAGLRFDKKHRRWRMRGAITNFVNREGHILCGRCREILHAGNDKGAVVNGEFICTLCGYVYDKACEYETKHLSG